MWTLRDIGSPVVYLMLNQPKAKEPHVSSSLFSSQCPALALVRYGLMLQHALSLALALSPCVMLVLVPACPLKMPGAAGGPH